MKERPFEAIGEEPILEMDVHGYNATVRVIGIIEGVRRDGGHKTCSRGDFCSENFGRGSVAVGLSGPIAHGGA